MSEQCGVGIGSDMTSSNLHTNAIDSTHSIIQDLFFSKKKTFLANIYKVLRYENNGWFVQWHVVVDFAYVNLKELLELMYKT